MKYKMDRRFAYAIPNLFTAGSLICALVALKLITTGDFIQATWLITLSIVLDGFDGGMAKILKATSKLGAEADSLTDFVAFGVVAGFLAFEYSLRHFGFIGFFVFIVYVLCGGFRLARFNVLQANTPEKKNFMGLPIPAAAATICSFILVHETVFYDISAHFILLVIMTLVSCLMVSRIPYIAVNKTTRGRKLKGLIVITVVSVAILAIFHTIWVYLACAWLYIFYGLYNNVRQLMKGKKRPKFVWKRIKK